MSTTRPLVPLISRGINPCLDLAMMFWGRFASLYLGIWLLIAVPATAAVYGVSLWTPIDIRWVLLTSYFASWPLGVLIMNDAIPRIFAPELSQEFPTDAKRIFGRAFFLLGVSLVATGLLVTFLAGNLGEYLGMSDRVKTLFVSSGLSTAALAVILLALVAVARHQELDGRLFRVFCFGLLLRILCGIGFAMLLFPPFQDWRWPVLLFVTIPAGLWLGLRTGFLLEKTCLTRISPSLHTAEAKDALREETGELIGRASWLGQFCLVLWGLAFLTADAFSSLVFRTPILLGRLQPVSAEVTSKEFLEQLGTLFIGDPLVLVTLTATGLFVYPFARFAWLFCYIDIRVRRGCWDLELRFATMTEELKQQRLKHHDLS